MPTLHPIKAFIDRGCQYLLIRPPKFAPPVEGGVAYVQQTPPLSLVFGDAVQCQEPGVDTPAPVVGLFDRISPIAILWAVVAVVILAVKCVAVRALSHVFSKLSKDRPSWPDGDAAAPVSRIFMKIRVVASLTHHLPSHVKRMVFVTHKTLQGGWTYILPQEAAWA